MFGENFANLICIWTKYFIFILFIIKYRKIILFNKIKKENDSISIWMEFYKFEGSKMIYIFS